MHVLATSEGRGGWDGGERRGDQGGGDGVVCLSLDKKYHRIIATCTADINK